MRCDPVNNIVIGNWLYTVYCILYTVHYYSWRLSEAGELPATCRLISYWSIQVKNTLKKYLITDDLVWSSSLITQAACPPPWCILASSGTSPMFGHPWSTWPSWAFTGAISEHLATWGEQMAELGTKTLLSF